MKEKKGREKIEKEKRKKKVVYCFESVKEETMWSMVTFFSFFLLSPSLEEGEKKAREGRKWREERKEKEESGEKIRLENWI